MAAPSSTRASISTPASESLPTTIAGARGSAGTARVLRFRLSDCAGSRAAASPTGQEAWSGRAKHREMTPLELLPRLAALVPPPRYPLTRFHGVLAPHAAWRREIVPRPPTIPKHRTDTARHNEARVGSSNGSYAASTRGSAATGQGGTSSAFTNRSRQSADRSDEPSRRPPPPERTEPRASFAVAEQARTRVTGGAAPREVSAGVATLAPNILSVRHWSRLLGGLLYATSPRVRWPELLRRTFYDRVKVFYHAVLSYVGLREHRYAISSIRSLLPLKSTVSPARAPSISSKMGAIVEIPMISWPWHVNLAVETAMMK